MKYYWIEWGGAWGLWVDDGETVRRCLYRISPAKGGMWRVDRVSSYDVKDRKYVVRYNDLERAKARAVIEARFTEGESK